MYAPRCLVCACRDCTRRIDEQLFNWLYYTQVLKIGRVIGSAVRPETIEYSKAHGADETINHRNPLADELAKLGLKVRTGVLLEAHHVHVFYLQLTRFASRAWTTSSTQASRSR